MLAAALTETSPTAVDAPAPRLFHVHLFAVVRREVRKVPALSLRNAVEAAFSQLPHREFSERFDSDTTEFADEFSHYLVDVDGDDEFTQSRFLTSAQEPLLEFLRRLVAWHDDGRPEAELEALLGAARAVLAGAV